MKFPLVRDLAAEGFPVRFTYGVLGFTTQAYYSCDGPDVQGFVGGLHRNGAAGGVFITTIRFTPGAVSFAKGINPRVILIDGERLGAPMFAAMAQNAWARHAWLREVDHQATAPPPDAP